MLALCLSVIASGVVGPAVSYALGQGATLVAAIWGVLIWREFRHAPEGTNRLIVLVFVAYAGGLALVGMSSYCLSISGMAHTPTRTTRPKHAQNRGRPPPVVSCATREVIRPIFAGHLRPQQTFVRSVSCAGFMQDRDTARLSSVRLHQRPAHLAGSGVLHSRQGQQRRSTLRGVRIGPAGHQTRLGFQSPSSC